MNEIIKFMDDKNINKVRIENIECERVLLNDSVYHYSLWIIQGDTLYHFVANIGDDYFKLSTSFDSTQLNDVDTCFKKLNIAELIIKAYLQWEFNKPDVEFETEKNSLLKDK